MQRARVVNGIIIFLNVTDHALLIDDEGHAVGKKAGKAQDAVSFGDYFIGVAKQGKTGVGLFRALAVPLLGIEADAQNLRAGGLEFGDIRLISLDFASSTRSGGAGIKRQNHRLLAVKVGKPHDLPVLVRQGKIRSTVANLKIRGCTEQWHKEDPAAENHREFYGSAHARNPCTQTLTPHATLKS